MLTSLHVEQYRGFDRYRIDRLTQVNLLVGQNNCGKTSLLEAAYFLALKGDPAALAETAWRRGEIVVVEEEDVGLRRPLSLYPDVSHFFHGHEIEARKSFRCSTSGNGNVVVVRILDEFDEAQFVKKQPGLSPNFAIEIEFAGDRIRMPLTDNGAIPIEVPIRFGRSTAPNRRIQFIAPDSLEPFSMREMWDRVGLEGRESEVVAAMRILDPQIANIFFQTSERSSLARARAGILVGFDDGKRRVPLGSLGDGMRRILALALSIVQAGGGVLLVDEIDTGLHWSVMGDVWKFLVEASIAWDVQVFATTHSLDCLRGLAWWMKHHPERAGTVLVHKIDTQLDSAITMDAMQVEFADEHGMEMR